MIITIGRECGCRGDSIGRALAKKFNISFYDKSAIKELAKKSGAYDKYPNFFAEKPVNSLIYSIAIEENVATHDTPKKAFDMLLDEENFVVIGRASNVAFKDKKDVIRLFVSGERRQRIEYIKKKHDISERKAERLVSETDERRANYQNFYTGTDWGYSENYDLCLDVTKLGVDGVVAMVELYAERMGYGKVE